MTATNQVQGRKRQLAVETGGRRLAAHVGPANENDRTGGRAVLEKLHRQGFARLQLGLTSSGYDGRSLAEWVQAHCGWRLETAPGLTGRGGFTPQPYPVGRRTLHQLAALGPTLQPRLRMRNQQRRSHLVFVQYSASHP